MKPPVTRDDVTCTSDDTCPIDLLDSSQSFLTSGIPDLPSSDEALVALAKSIVYKSFDAGDGAYHDSQDVLMLRHGCARVEKTWWSAEVRDRIRSTPDASSKITNQRGANA